tara:strand:- start:367 stop:561 length:195 start_codon:yes stop_codon:yes gene_type:complete
VVTETVEQEAGPCVICNVLSGTPKDCKDSLIVERTIEFTVTLRESVKAAAVVSALVIAWYSCGC